MCKILSISRASYYKWLHHKETAEEKENKQIMEWILEFDEKYKHTLGYRRMRNYINREKNKSYSKKRIHRLMKLLGVKSVIRRKKNTYKPSKPEAVAENILARDFAATRPNEKWATDVTEFKIPETSKKLYLSAIIDLYDRSIIAHMLSTRNDNFLVFETYKRAIATNPDAKPILHSDRGFQYTSSVFQSMLKAQGVIQSMSRVSRCIDNGPTEGFWGIIKSEMYYVESHETEEDLRQAIEDYIYYYNHGRYQERFHNLAPLEVREAALNTEYPQQYPIPENKRIAAYWASIEAKKSA